MNADLAGLLGDVASARRAGADGGAQGLPPRGRDESVEHWLSVVASARTDADRRAVEHRRIVDRAARLRFGVELSQLVPSARADLERSSFTLATPLHAQLAELGPVLSGAPVGAQPPSLDALAAHVVVRVTAPRAPRAAIVRLHGGAFWMGGGEVSHAIDGLAIERMAHVANAAVFDVDYRLAPEHPFPAAIIDTLTVLAAVRSGIGGLPALAPIALAGTSSGGNIAALAAQADAAIRPNEPGLAALALVVPSLLLSKIPDTAWADAQSWQHRQAQLAGYLGTAVAPQDRWASPAVAPVISGVPPVFAAVAEFDEVAFGADRFCHAVRAGGGHAEHRTYPMTHVTATPHVEATMIEDLAQFLAERLA